MKHLYWIITALLVGCQSANVEQYQVYRNAKYNFSVEYPVNLLTPLPESDMGDGRRFVSKDGKDELTVVYEYIDPEELEKDQDELKAVYRYIKKRYDKKLEFEHVDKDYFLLLGRQGMTVYYEKYIVKDGFVCSCTFVFPYEKMEFYREPSKRIFATFR